MKSTKIKRSKRILLDTLVVKYNNNIRDNDNIFSSNSVSSSSVLTKKGKGRSKRYDDDDDDDESAESMSSKIGAQAATYQPSESSNSSSVTLDVKNDEIIKPNINLPTRTNAATLPPTSIINNYKGLSKAKEASNDDNNANNGQLLEAQQTLSHSTNSNNASKSIALFILLPIMLIITLIMIVLVIKRRWYHNKHHEIFMKDAQQSNLTRQQQKQSRNNKSIGTISSSFEDTSSTIHLNYGCYGKGILGIQRLQDVDYNNNHRQDEYSSSIENTVYL